MGPTWGPNWVLSAPDGPHVGPMNLAIRDGLVMTSAYTYHHSHVGGWRIHGASHGVMEPKNFDDLAVSEPTLKLSNHVLPLDSLRPFPTHHTYKAYRNQQVQDCILIWQHFCSKIKSCFTASLEYNTGAAHPPASRQRHRNTRPGYTLFVPWSLQKTVFVMVFILLNKCIFIHIGGFAQYVN